jgi:hypothetical protein
MDVYELLSKTAGIHLDEMGDANHVIVAKINEIQTSSAFGFLFFMGRSRKKVDSRQLTVHRQEKGQGRNTENTEAGARRSQRRKRLMLPAGRDLRSKVKS